MAKTIEEKDHVAFNLFRESKLGKEFKRDEMKQMLKKLCGYPASDQFLMCITADPNPPIIKVRRGVYAVNPKPVYKERLQTVFDEYANTIKSETVKNKKKISIEEAILRLKETGEYQILKKKVTIEWVEI